MRIRCFRRVELNVNILVDITHSRGSRPDTRLDSPFEDWKRTKIERQSPASFLHPFSYSLAWSSDGITAPLSKMAKDSEIQYA